MIKSILQQLFDGEIFPAEHINLAKTNKEYREINHDIENEKEYFFNILSSTDVERFDKLNASQDLSTEIYGGECFSHGFRLGASILIEIFYDTTKE